MIPTFKIGEKVTDKKVYEIIRIIEDNSGIYYEMKGFVGKFKEIDLEPVYKN